MRFFFISILATVLIFSSGCTATPETVLISTNDDEYRPVVSVTGKLLPEVRAHISTQMVGMIVDLLVYEGDSVSAGDLLVKLDDRDAAIALQQAEAALSLAEAQFAQILSGPRIEEVTVAEARISAAQTVISQTIAQRDLLSAGGYSVDRAAIQAQIEALKADRFIANQQHDDSMKCYDVQQPDGSTERYCPTLGTIEEQTRMALQAADAALKSAETQLDMHYSQHQAQLRIADAGVLVAQEQADVARTQLQLIQADVPQEAVSVAEAVVNQAEVAVNLAKLALERTEVRAPFSGVIGKVNIREGEYTLPGQPMLVIGDLGTLRVETTDLDEIDVAQITLNQKAIITFEALPNETFDSTVNFVSTMASSDSGGVNYTVYLSLDHMHPKLRWGMTAFVDIETQ
jgi:multidrug resistance efflux pump